MKKSEIYRVAQCAVLKSVYAECVKLEVLRELMDKEDMAKFVEKQKEEENANEAI